MSTERLELGPTPHGEACAQVGSPDYEVRALAECKAYCKQLWRILWAAAKAKQILLALLCAPKIKIRGHAHDFGTYYEVEASFDTADHIAAAAAYWLEQHLPEKWDDEARKELGL